MSSVVAAGRAGHELQHMHIQSSKIDRARSTAAASGHRLPQRRRTFFFPGRFDGVRISIARPGPN